MVEFVKYFTSIRNFTFTSELEKYYQNRLGFTIGHDKKFRPVIYVFPGRVKEEDLGLFADSMSFLSLIIQRQLLRDYHIENWVIILDLEKRGFTNFPFRALQALARSSSIMFAGRMHKMFMLNPSFIFYGLWKLMSKFIPEDTAPKISILKKEGFSEILDVIDKDQLIERYGGTMKEPESTFPLQSTFRKDDSPWNEASELTDDNYVDPCKPVSDPFGSFRHKTIVSLQTIHVADWDVA
jgi:hypothetical protein